MRYKEVFIATITGMTIYIDQLNEEPTEPSWKYRIEEKEEIPGEILYENISLIRNRCTR